jgi:glyoxylase-like metal-dependent hydrolase (beta-lactamase superfamily II)
MAHAMKVELLNVGWMTASAALWRQGEDPQKQARCPVPAYLIETDSERILVDTGLHPQACTDGAGFYESPETMSLFSLEQDLALHEQVDLDTVTMVVITHLHWDHAGGLSFVPESVPVVIQRREWEAGHDPAAVTRNFFFPRDYAVDEGRLVLLDGDHDLLGDGSIELLFTPGHTPGHQSVRVGDLVIGADVVHYADGLDDRRFPAFGDDLEEQGRSAERLCGLRDAGLTVMPGHDPEVLHPGTVTA